MSSISNSPPTTYRTSSRRFRVYVAAGSTERLPVARPWIDRLIAAGIDVVDWTRDPNWSLGRIPTEAEFVESAQRDVVAIGECDLFWYIVPDQKSEGAAVELGYAQTLGKRIIASGSFGAHNIFALLIPREMRFASNKDAFAAVIEAEANYRKFVGEF